MRTFRSALIALAVVAAFGLAGCSSSGDTTASLDPVSQAQINGLQERVTSLERRVTWLEVIGREAIKAAPTKYTEQLTTDVARLEADMATAEANAAAASEQVAAEKAAAEKALADAKAAVDAAVAAENAEDAARATAIETAGQRVAEAQIALDAFIQKLQDAASSTSPSGSPSPTGS